MSAGVNAPKAATQDASATALPPAEHPVWAALLLQRLALDVRALSLRLLLTKLTREAQAHHDADLHRQAATSLRLYFERNERLLRHECAQVRQKAAAMPQVVATAPTPREVPELTDPLWLALLSGETDIEIRSLSLRLLLGKLRAQAQAAIDDDIRVLKLVELHRYFERNQRALQHELAQLHRDQRH